MHWKKEYLDAVLVPIGLLIMIGYQLLHVYRIVYHPHTTVIGHENNNKRAWVDRMIQADSQDKSLALTVISSNITAATYLSSVSIALSSLIGAWLANSSNNTFMSSIIYGDKRPPITSIKYLSLLTCFLVAFASFIQSARYFVHANFLISMPKSTDLPVSYVQNALIRGGIFWAVGLRALYFASALLFWIFGSIPMFLSSLIMVVTFSMVDRSSTKLLEYPPAPQPVQ